MTPNQVGMSPTRRYVTVEQAPPQCAAQTAKATLAGFPTNSENTFLTTPAAQPRSLQGVELQGYFDVLVDPIGGLVVRAFATCNLKHEGNCIVCVVDQFDVIA